MGLIATVKSHTPMPVKQAAHYPAKAWREATAGHRAMPDFIILGAARGGTTSLYE